MIKYTILTLFPEMTDHALAASILGRAQKAGLIEVESIQIRDFTTDKHRLTEDSPYGGGPGMVMKAEPILRTLQSVYEKSTVPKEKMLTIFFSPRGELFSEEKSQEYANNYEHIIMICGRYEGVDARVLEAINPALVSVGPYVLTGGELPAMIVVDAVSRKIPGVLGNEESLEEVRNASEKVYTRPEVIEWEGKEYAVPKILLEGHHAKIEEWRKEN